MPVCTMPPESCTAQHAMPATVTIAATAMAAVRPFPPQETRAGLPDAAEAAETFSVIAPPYTR